MDSVTIDTKRNVRKTVLLTRQEAAEIEDFRVWLRADLGRVPSESHAIAELIREGLKRRREDQQRNKGKQAVSAPKKGPRR